MKAMSKQYRVLSLDLHDTVVWDTREIVDAQYEVRWNVLARGLRTAGGSRPSSEQLRKARDALYADLRSQGRPIESVPVTTQVESIRRFLGARYDAPMEEVVQSYAEGGLREHPPVFNPEAQALVGFLNQLGFPVVVITDTSRTGSAWKSFLERAGGLQLLDVVASTDVGACKPDRRIFLEAVHRAGVAAAQVLHVGDRWRWDVEGARGSGLGAALYRGLWSRAWDSDAREDEPPDNDASITCLDHLSEVLGLIGFS